MKLRKIMLALMTCASAITITSPNLSSIFANEFEGNELYWQNKCSVAQSTQEEANKCAEFKNYYEYMSQGLESEIDQLKAEVSKIQSNMNDVAEGVKNIENMIQALDKKINRNMENIKTIKQEMISLDQRMKKIKEDIRLRDEMIKNRMVDEQVNMGTNMKIEIIMGSSDLIDMIRKIDGMQKITKSDQKEIEKLVDDQKQLELQKEEQERLKTSIEEKNEQIKKDKKEAQEVKKEKERLLSIYRKKAAELNEKMRSVQTDMSSIQNSIININTSILKPSNPNKPGGQDQGGHVPGFDSKSMMAPVRGQRTAGTWQYPGGGVHLGLDYGAPIGTPVVAPADGIVLFANNSVATNNGYLGNWVGYPAGAGNSIHYLTQVKGITYGISFFHLAKENFYATPGGTFKKGEVMAHVGNSGNSTGPHTHVEVVNLGHMSLEAAAQKFNQTADFSWGTGWGDGAISNVCSVSGAPCRERPEEMFH